MNIGSVSLNNAGQLVGAISTLGIDLPQVWFRPVTTRSERGPVFEIIVPNVAKRPVKIGALWERVSEETGECYLSGSIEDPSLSAPLYVAAFKQEDGSLSIAWSRPRRNADFAAKGKPAEAGDSGFPDLGNPFGETPAEPRRRNRRAEEPAEAPAAA